MRGSKEANGVLGMTALAVALIAGPAAAQAPPAPQPLPGGPPHVFYGAVPPSPPATAKPWVLVFLHGLNGVASHWWDGNDMYALAFGAGYRTAFVSMGPDNQPDDAAFPDHAPVVRDALSRIVQHYDTDKVVIVGHSMGGLDAQAAMLDPATLALVRAVFTISTPNTGTELADWAFGPGQALAGQLGLLTPGVESLTIENVAAFRETADPVFRASGIPFYTIAGTDARGNIITEITGLILYDRTRGQQNDGFVTQARSRLPQDYANDLGQARTNHFEVDSGSETFAKIHARLQVLEYTMARFKSIASGGLGDPHNNWMWSMEWFKGKLYVGTGREIQCLSLLTSDVQQGTTIYPISVLVGDCPDGPTLAKSLAAEVWSFDPATEEWQRVFKSPEDVLLGPIDGEFVYTARDVGFRGMTVFREPDGTEALYVGGVTSGSVYEKLPQFAAGYPPPRLLRSVDGVTFEPVPQDPGTFLGDIGNPLPGSTRALRSFRGLTAYKGMLFATIGDFRGLGVVVASANPKAGDDAWHLASGVTEAFPVWNLTAYNGFLYATTGDKDHDNVGFGVFKTDATGPPPYNWIPIITNGAYQTDPKLRPPNGLSFATFNGQLYVGMNRPTELYRINRDDTWDLIVGEPRDTPLGMKRPLSGLGIGFGSFFNGHFWRMTTHGGKLYVTTWDSSTGLRFLPAYDKIFGFQFGFDFFRTQDGVHWEAITRGGFWDTGNIGGRSILSTEAGLFVGTARNKDGAQVYRCSPPDCTALEPPPGGIDRPRLLESQSEEVSATEVRLGWLPVSGAVRYRIYRSTVLAITEFLPGDIPINIPGIGEVTLNDIRNGALDHLCTPATPQICQILENIKEPPVGLPTPFVQIAIRTAPFFVEPAPSPYQAIYFVRAEDADGNLSSPSNFVGGPSKAPAVGTDATLPVIRAAVSPAPNAAAWNNSDATVIWDVSDPDTGIASTNFCEPQAVTTETGGVTLACSAVNGRGMSASASVTVRLDKTPPVIGASASPPANPAGWSDRDVTVSFTCADALSGLASCGPPSRTLGEGAGQFATATASDLAGNPARLEFGPVNVDKTPPEGLLVLGISARNLVVRATDGLSGVAVLEVPPSSVEPALAAEGCVDGGRDTRRRRAAGQAGALPCPRSADERRVYRIEDRAGNQVELTVLVRLSTGELESEIESLRYGSGPPLDLPYHRIKLEWWLDRSSGALRRVDQRMQIGEADPDRQVVRAWSDTNMTFVEVVGPSRSKEKKDGLFLLGLSTREGGLRVELIDASTL